MKLQLLLHVTEMLQPSQVLDGSVCAAQVKTGIRVTLCCTLCMKVTGSLRIQSFIISYQVSLANDASSVMLITLCAALFLITDVYFQ